MKLTKNIGYSLIALWLLTSLVACDLEKDIDVELPTYAAQPIVECYLEPGKPMRLLLSKSVAFFDDFDFNNAAALLINDAAVSITYNGTTHTLNNGFSIDTSTSLKIYNYIAPQLVVADYTQPFELTITLADGKTITGRTQFLAPPTIDSTTYDFQTIDDTVRARVISYFKDVVPGQRNYYRRQLHLNTLDSIPRLDFAFINDFVDNGQLAVGSGYWIEKGDTAISTVYRMDKDYYEFWKSVTSSQQANGNPFAQPGAIYKTLGGTANALGIFTTLSYVRDTTVIE